MTHRLGSLIALLTMSLVALTLLYLLAANAAVAAEGRTFEPGGSSVERPHRGPPQVALDACRGLAAGTQCQFTGRRGEPLAGECFVTPDEQLACKPEGHERRMKQRASFDRDQDGAPRP